MIKVAISGTHGTGKTALQAGIVWKLKSLRKKVAQVKETAGECPHLNGGSGDSFKAQLWILSKQLELEAMAVSKLPDFVVCDRATWDTKVYSEYAFGESKMSKKEYWEIVRMCRAWYQSYDLILLTEDDGSPVEDDGVRNTKDEKFRSGVAEIFVAGRKEPGAEHGLPEICLLEGSLTYEQRLDQAVAKILAIGDKR